MRENIPDVKELVLIDDSPIDNFICKKILECISDDFTVTIFENAVDGLVYLKEMSDNMPHFPSCIIIDINMPMYSGWQFLSDYQRLNLHKKSRASLYLISATTRKDDIEKAGKLNIVADFIQKPLTAFKLKNAIDRKE